MYTDKGYEHVNNVICKNKELNKVKYVLVYPDATKWLTELNVKINTVDPSVLPDATTGLHPNIKLLTTKTHFSNK